MMRFHPSSVGLLMTDAQSVDIDLVPAALHPICAKARKTDEDRALLAPYKEASLSAGAKTFLRTLAKEQLYSYHKVIENKYLDKGLALEDEAIEFLCHRRFARYVKNTERRTNDFLTGECDIHVPGVKTIDTKCAWSLDTFPALSEESHDPLYEWQGRAYMMLWPDVQEHEVVHIMLDTPDDLLPAWEQRELHKVSHIDPELRITSITYKRDLALEVKLERKCRTAQAYLAKLIWQMKFERGMLDDEPAPAAPAATESAAPDWRARFKRA